MKCLAVFSSLPDLLYIWLDSAYERKLHERAQVCGIASEECNVVMYAEHLFSPLVTSSKYMKATNNAYHSMLCEDGTVFVMKEISNLSFIAVCGDGDESELFLQRKIFTFSYLLNMHYGPCVIEELKSPYPTLRSLTWNMWDQVLHTWTLLCQQEQMFLVESLERLHVNQQLSHVSLSLLGDVLVRTNRDGHTIHAMLLVNNKLLALYSTENSQELHASDILMLTLLAKRKFKYKDETVPASICRTPSLLIDDAMQLKDDRSLFEFHEHRSMPVDTMETGSASSAKLDFHSVDSSVMDEFHTPSTPIHFQCPDHEEYDDSFDLTMNDADLEFFASSVEDNDVEDDGVTLTRSSAHEPNLSSEESNRKEEEDEDEEIPDYFQQSVFLRTDQCKYTPHTAHFLLLEKSSTLVVIAQNRHMKIASIIHALLSRLHCTLGNLEWKLPSYRRRLFDDSCKYVHKLQMFLHKQVETQTEQLELAVRKFERTWKLVQDSGYAKYLTEVNCQDLPQRLEGTIIELIKAIKFLFSRLYISVTQQRLSRYERQMKVILNVREMATRKLNHFNMYLQVRGTRNVTMTAYHNDFPGLVHFVYVNRNTNRLIAPTINVNTDSRTTTHKLPIYIVVKQRIWDFWQYAELMLTKGFTSLAVRDGDFTYSYFLWFEDVQGNPLASQKSLKELNEGLPTGIVSGSYYKDLIRHLFPMELPGNVQCYELLCMHVGVVNNHFVSTSCRKLARQMWESSGEANTSINLL